MYRIINLTQLLCYFNLNSRTGKAGEADIIIGIGMDDSDACARGKRKFYISKNKINGDHSSFDCIMNHRRGVFDDDDGS